MDDREALEWILRDLILEFLLSLGPGGALQVEAVDTDTFLRDGESLFDTARLVDNNLLLDFCLGLYGIERPLLFTVQSSDLLQGSSKETLRVIEASEPERDGARALREP